MSTRSAPGSAVRGGTTVDRPRTVWWTFLACLMAFTLTLAACAGDEEEPPDADEPAESDDEEPDEREPDTDDNDEVAEFYSDNDVRIIVGLAAGGSVDGLARVVAEHLPQYIPGNPTIIVENMEGAGSLIAANAVATTEPDDGTVIAAVVEGVFLEQLADSDEVRFDLADVNWLGSLQNAPYMLLARVDHPAGSVEDLMNGEQLVVGTVGVGSAGHTVPVVLRDALGLNLEILPGYDGAPAMTLALEQGEIDAFSVTVVGGQAQELMTGDDPLARSLVVMGSEVPPVPHLDEEGALDGVPAAEALAPDEDARQLLEAVNAPQAIARPYFMAAGVPEERAVAMQRAFADMLADEAFLEAANNIVPVDPSDADTVTATVQTLLRDLSEDVLEQLRELL